MKGRPSGGKKEGEKEEEERMGGSKKRVINTGKGGGKGRVEVKRRG